MKKLGKLTINPDKIIRNEELVNLRGGYGGSGTCAAKHGTQCFDNLDRAAAIHMAVCQDKKNGTNCEGNWCCDSCGSATWYPCV